jgi:hypothetical protein
MNRFRFGSRWKDYRDAELAKMFPSNWSRVSYGAKLQVVTWLQKKISAKPKVVFQNSQVRLRMCEIGFS